MGDNAPFSKEAHMNAKVYSDRRAALREAVSGGAILLPGNLEAPRNYVDNPYPFR